MKEIIVEIEDLGNNKWIAIIEGNVYEIYAPNEITAKSRAIEKHL